MLYACKVKGGSKHRMKVLWDTLGANKNVAGEAS